jgi:hypothetical protein
VTMRASDDHVKKVMSQQQRWKFDLITFDDGETIEDYVLCVSGMVVHLTTLSEEVRIVRSSQRCFELCLLQI